MATTEEKLLTYLANSKNGGQLPVLVNVQGSEFFIIYNPSTDRFEKVLISTLLTDDLIIDALGYTPEDIANKAIDFSVKNNNLYPSTKAVDDFITSLKSAPNGLAGTDGDGKIPAILLPPIAVTSVILATQTTIADFAANSGSYTFEQGDVIILDSGNGSYYMYNGGVKTDVSAYNEITASEIDWSQVTNVPNDVTNPDLDYVLKNGDQSSENIILGGFLRTDDNLVIKPSNGQMTGSAGYNSIGFFVDNVLFLKQVGSTVALRVSFDDINGSRDVSFQNINGKIPILSSTDVNDGDFEINGTLAAQNLVLKAIAEDNAATKILVIDALGNTKYIDKSSIGGNFVTLDTVQTITSRKTFDVTTENPDTGIIINNDRVSSKGFVVNNNGGASRGVTIYNNAGGSSAGIYIVNNDSNGIEIVNNQGSQSAIDIDVNASTGIILNTKQISTKAIRLNRDNGGGGIEIIDNNTSLSGSSIYVNNKSNNDAITVVSSDGSQGDAFRLSKFVSGGTTEDRFKIDSEGNTTTQQLKIEDVSENLTAPKFAVLDNDGNVGSISTDNVVILDDKKVVPSNNWDALDKTGYYTNTANNIPTLPENVDGLLVMHLDNGTNASQTAYRVGQLKMWIRKKVSSVWSDWEEVYHTGNLIPNRTIDSATTQTSTSLNSAFPVASNPVGTTVTNINALQLFMYVRISELLWRVITLGTTI